MVYRPNINVLWVCVYIYINLLRKPASQECQHYTFAETTEMGFWGFFVHFWMQFLNARIIWNIIARSKTLFKDKFQWKTESLRDRTHLHDSKPTHSLQGGEHLSLNNEELDWDFLHNLYSCLQQKLAGRKAVRIFHSFSYICTCYCRRKKTCSSLTSLVLSLAYIR